MPIDPNTGEELPYEGEPGYEESLAANPEAYTPVGAEGELDFASRVESLMLDQPEGGTPVEVSEEALPAEALSPEEIQGVAERLFAQMYGPDAPIDPAVIQMIAAEIAANPEILSEGDIVAALEIFAKLNPQGQTPEEEAVPVV